MQDPVSWLILLSGLLYLGGAAMTGHADDPYGSSHGIFVRSRADPPLHGRAAHPRHPCSPGGDPLTRAGSIP